MSFLESILLELRMKKVVVDIFFKKMYYFSFEKVIIKLDMVVPCSCKIHYLPQVFMFFFRLTFGVGPHKGRMKFPSSVQSSQRNCCVM